MTIVNGLDVGEAAIDPDVANVLHCTVDELEQAVEQQLPGYKMMLSRIKAILLEEPQCVTLLQPEDRAVIVRAMAMDKGIALEFKAAKAAKSRAKKTPTDLLGAL